MNNNLIYDLSFYVIWMYTFPIKCKIKIIQLVASSWGVATPQILVLRAVRHLVERKEIMEVINLRVSAETRSRRAPRDGETRAPSLHP